ncbi:MAG TPA: FAD-dependent oxidoreductase [Pyrinomonadaceae bacterium]|nr:FAD-dependent oxidoreductase [Pyrinomonadaceae bacterium]
MKGRPEALENIAGKTFDVCVIGGGATGAGCALDAQLRGLNTVLVDGGDFASATSSASTKLIHGGVRYLQQAVTRLDLSQYRVVKRALRERSLMMRNAPFLARPLELLIPCFSWFEFLYYGSGMKLYDWISGKSSLLPSRFLSRRESLRRMPMLAASNGRLVGTIAYADGQFDDTRFNMTLVQTLTEAGGEALNHARVIGFHRRPDGKLVAAQLEDSLSRRSFTLQARAFVNATGPFSDTVRSLANPSLAHRLRLSKGIHILFPLELFEGRDALMVPKTEDGRVLFAIPWLGRLLVGTTESESNLKAEMLVQRSEAEYVLRQLNPYLRAPLTLQQIVSGFAGLRPLVSSGAAGETKRLIRDHEVELDPASGLISILGGKWTTYRAMAEDTIDHVQRYLGASVIDSPTRHHPLCGSENYSADYWRTLMTGYRVSESSARHLAGKFGTRAPQVLQLAVEQPALMQPIIVGLAPLRAEIVFAIREEMAESIEDILARRIGLQVYDWRLTIQAAPVVAFHLAQELGWSPSETHHAVELYTSKVNRMLETIGLAPEPVPVAG